MTETTTDILDLKGRGVVSIIGAGGKTTLMFCLADQLSKKGLTVLTTTTTKIFVPGKDQSPCIITASCADELMEKSRQALCRYPCFSAGREINKNLGKLEGFSIDVIDTLHRSMIFDWIIVEADGARQKPVKASAAHEPVPVTTTTHLVLVTGLDAVGTVLDDNFVHRPELFAANTGILPGSIIDDHAIASCIETEIRKSAAMCSPNHTYVVLNKADTPDSVRSGQKIADLLYKSTDIDKIIITSLFRHKKEQ